MPNTATTRHPLLIAIALLAASAVSAAVAPAAGADTRLDGPYAPSKVATYGGVTVWSRYFPDQRTWRLVYDTNTSGRSDLVPVAGRSVPFDVDVGPDQGEGVVAVYSRCTTEPRFRASTRPLPAWTTGRGCDLYRYDFRQGTETRIGGASTAGNSEMLPTIWRGHLGFVRVYDERPYLYVRDIGPNTTSRRQPGGGRGSTNLPGPMALDLVGDQLAFSWTYERSGGGVSEVRLDNVGGGHRKIVGKGWEDSLLRYVTPTLSDGYVEFGEQRMLESDGGDTRSLGSWLWRYRSSTGELDRADAPAQLFAAVRDRRSQVAVYGTTSDGLNFRGCGPRGCLIYRAPFGEPDFVHVRIIAAPSRSCGDVTYTPQTDHGAFNITQRGTTCPVARAVARYAENRRTPFTTRGFACRGTGVEGALPSTRVQCARADGARITFTRS